MRRYRGVVAPTAGAGSSTLPVASIYSGGATNPLWLTRIKIFNTTATAVRLALTKLTTRGTPGAAVTEAEFVDADTNNVAEVFNTHTVAPTLAAVIDVIDVPAGIGAAAPITELSRLDTDNNFETNENGIYIPAGTANGLGLLPIGTGQVLDVMFEFGEQ